MDVAAIFDRPSKFFTIVREPVDRVISNFFFNRTATDLTSYPFIKDLTLEEYLDSGLGLDHDNVPVRSWTPLGTPRAGLFQLLRWNAVISKWPSATLRNASSSQLRWKSSPLSFGS
jgi:hypothetical protein